MLRHIEITKYKSFKRLNLQLRPLVVIMGPNAAGKSNFVDAIYLLSKFASSHDLKQAFDGHRGLPLESMWYGAEGFKALLDKDAVRASFQADVQLSDEVKASVEQTISQKRHGLDSEKKARKRVTESLLRYGLDIEVLPRTGVVRVVDEHLEALRKTDHQPKKSRRAFLERINEKLRLRMEGQARPTEFQTGLDHTILSTSLYEPHYPHVNAVRTELSRWCTYYLEPRRLMREDVPVSDVHNMGPRGENFAAFLNTLKQRNPAEFAGFQKTVKALLPSRPEVDVELNKEGTVGLKVVEDGLEFSGRLISEGTLRVMGLVAAIHPANPATLIAYEEPENGVHPVRIKMIADILKRASETYKKQVIVTTHSALFAGCFGTQDLYVCRTTKEGSKIESFEDAGPLLDGPDIQRALSDAVLRGDIGG